jgi:ubiquinone/menaquinone biosynthesis C-methylase UbiE
MQPADSLWLGVKDGYERWAATYDRTPNPVIAREERYFEPFIRSLEGNRVLDLACGTGRWLEKALAKGVRLGAGVDWSPAMLRVAGKKRSLQGKLIRADCLSLPFRSAVFDFVICSFALGHVRELQNAARELARVTQPKGEIFVSDLHPEASARGWRTGFREAALSVEIEAFRRSRQEMIATFQAEGMDCVACESLSLGDPERPIFVAAHRLARFVEASGVPAVLVCRFRRQTQQTREQRDRRIV